MVYVVIRPRTEESLNADCHFVKAKDKERALEILGLDDSVQWAVFTEDEVRSIANTQEGYVTGLM